MLNKITAFADEFDMLPPGGVILAGVSGGADSMCLLSALTELAPPRGLAVIAAHYNHRLRGEESDRDERFVRDFCERSGIRLFAGSGDVAALAKHLGTGVEDAARRARYDFFETAAGKAGAQRVATAHTADDNAETVIMNLARGAGTSGLSGIPPVRGRIIRPMLTVTRDEVVSFITARGIPYVEDSTNASDIYTRNRVRGSVIPLLREINPRFLDAVTSASGILRADEEYLSGLARKFLSGKRADGAVRLHIDELLALPAVVAARVIRRLGGAAISHRHVDAVLALCRTGGFRRLSLPGITVYREQEHIVFGGDEPTEFEPVRPEIGQTLFIHGTTLKITCKSTVLNDTINKSLTTFHFKPGDICGKIIVRPRIAGDFIKISGRNGTKSLKKLFIDSRVPASRRGLVPVIADDCGVLAVFGFGSGDRARAEPGEMALEIKFEGAADND